MGWRPRRALDDDAALIVAYLQDGPGAPAEQEAADPVDEPVDERLAERAQGTSTGGLHRVGLRAGEDREELHEVLAAPAFGPRTSRPLASRSEPSRTIQARRRSYSAR